MCPPQKITVAIPTYNRAYYLGEAMQSVLDQTFDDFELLIIDNNSSDNTKDVVHSFTDERVKYIRNTSNIGIIGNWNRTIELSKGIYLNIFSDDDKMQPTFLESSTAVLDEFPKVGFTFTHCNKVDENGAFLRLWGYDFPPSGYMSGYEYLTQTVKYGSCLTLAPSVVVRKNAYAKAGKFEQVYGHNTFDFNMWIRLASQFDVYFIDKVLINYRIHSKQMSEVHWRTKDKPTGLLSSKLEVMNAIAILLKSSHLLHRQDAVFLATRLQDITSEATQLILQFTPNL